MAIKIKKEVNTKLKIRIRMYNVGFGDCFLLSIPTTDGIKKILIDCGSLKRKSKSIAEIAADVIDECKDADGVSRIDIVIVTHRHADHISGFVPNTWDNVEVGEVWMPWMESRTDESARKLRSAQNHRITELLEAFRVANVSADLQAVLLNARSNESSLDILHEGFAKARLALCAATRQVLASGLALLGVGAPERM